MADFEELANDVAALESRVADILFDAVREQLRGDAEGAAELERQLAKVRRSLLKAESVLRTIAAR
ncbi:MAG: hypothetical protein WAN30_00425 [Acidimicrobiales bacterium]